MQEWHNLSASVILKFPTFDKFSLELLFINFSPQTADDMLQKITDGYTIFHRTVNDKVNQSSFLFSRLFTVTQHGAMVMIWSKESFPGWYWDRASLSSIATYHKLVLITGVPVDN